MKGIDFKKIWKKLKPKMPLFLIIYVVLFCSTLALFTEFNTAPDENMRYDIVKYVADNMRIPNGGDPAVRSQVWGLSYAFQPITSQIMSGFILKFAMMVTSSRHVLMFAARAMSVIWMVVYAIFVLKISRKLFKDGVYRIIFVMATALIPQILYVGGYINNDSMGLATVAMTIYAWLVGIEKKWNLKTCIFLGFSLGLLLMSYYNVYGFALVSVFLFIGTGLVKRKKVLEILGKGLLIFWIAFMIAGWWFIRSAVLYNGDIFGLKTSREYSERYALAKGAMPEGCHMILEKKKPTECTIVGRKPSERETPANRGEDLFYMLWDRDWTRMVRLSFYGDFGYMSHPMNYEVYMVYELMVGMGLLGGFIYLVYKIYLKFFAKKKEALEPIYEPELEMVVAEKRILNISMITSAVIVVGLSIYYSYFNDFQPQGRYILPIAIPVMFFVIKGLEFILKDLSSWKRKIILGLFIVVLVLTPILELLIRILPNLS